MSQSEAVDNEGQSEDIPGGFRAPDMIQCPNCTAWAYPSQAFCGFCNDLMIADD